MNKPARFRAALLAALPDIANDPQRLSLFVERGHVRATTVPAQGWEVAYQLTAIIQDYAGDFDALAQAVIAWVAVEQPDILANPERSARGIRFECEWLDNEQADVQLEIDLTEAVRPASGGGFEHPPEPPADPTVAWLTNGRVA